VKVRLTVCFVLFLSGVTASLLAADRATPVRVANLYVSPDNSSPKLAEVDRGRELVVLETSREWVHVQALLGEEKMVTGWMLDKGVVRASMPEGDKIVFGEAVDSEDQASRRHGRRGADQDALRLYYRVYDFFPTSPLAGEALYRAADIRWQVDRADVMSRPSSRDQDPGLRERINEDLMKLVIKKFPGTKWADLAAFHLIDNKLCGDWQGASKCPDKEADLYEKYASEHPQSPDAPEALYQAASRRAALIEIYKTEEKAKKADESREQALSLAQKVIQQYSQSDWSNRAQLLLFLVQQGVPTYGNVVQ
jgi:outer membrane protein assembly factor BamD (BamD/ComL family)